MRITASVDIHAPRPEVWRLITDIEHAPEFISGIENIEIIEKPSRGIVGLKWKETRNMFGKTATETMWITEAEENDHYRTEARSHGAVYRSTISLAERGETTQLAMDFAAEPTTLAAKILASTLGLLFKGATRKALMQDLEDIKAAAEKGFRGDF